MLLEKLETCLFRTLCGKIKFLNALAGGTRNNYCVLKCYNTALICFILNLYVRPFKIHVQFYKPVSSHVLNIALEAKINPLELRNYTSNN